jgi:hypothetical protein
MRGSEHQGREAVELDDRAGATVASTYVGMLLGGTRRRGVRRPRPAPGQVRAPHLPARTGRVGSARRAERSTKGVPS